MILIIKDENGDVELNISIREMEYLLAVASEGNITRAAQKVYVTQPSLTQTIQKMEQYYETKLFIRGKKHMNPTRAGKVLIEACTKMVKIYRDAENELTDIADTKRGSLIIGMPFNLSSFIFPLLYSIYQKNYPDMRMVPVEGNSDELEKMLFNGVIDIGIMPLPLQSSVLKYQEIFTERLILSVPRKHKLNSFAFNKKGERFPSIDIKLADKEPFVLSLQGQRGRVASEKIFREANITPSVVFVTKNVETKKRMSAVGLGLTMFPEHYLDFFSSPEGACYYYMDGINSARWTVVAAYLEDAYFLKGSRDCLSILTKMFVNGHPYMLNVGNNGLEQWMDVPKDPRSDLRSL